MTGSRLPFLLIGVGRGGTSLLAACLAGHPGVVMNSEIHAVATLIGDDLPLRSTATLVEDRLAAFRAACDEDAAHHPGKVWGNKITTEQIVGLEEHNALNRPGVDVVECLLAAMAGYRIVFVTRHAFSCIDSKVRRTGQPFVRAAIRWCYGVRVFERLVERGGLTYWCKFEDLVADPRKTLQGVCDSLGLDFDDAMLAQTQSGFLLPEYRYSGFIAEKAQDLPQLEPGIVALVEPWLGRL
jgi:Sulfotransferase family